MIWEATCERCLFLGWAAAGIVSVAASAPAFAQTALSVARGKDLLERACAGRHAVASNHTATIKGTTVSSSSAIAQTINRKAEVHHKHPTTPYARHSSH